MTAATFLKKSQLKETTLHKVITSIAALTHSSNTGSFFAGRYGTSRMQVGVATWISRCVVRSS